MRDAVNPFMAPYNICVKEAMGLCATYSKYTSYTYSWHLRMKLAQKALC